MTQKVQIDQTVIRILYYKYKDYVVPGIIFIVAWVVFLQFAMPQIQTFLAEKDQVAASEQTLAVMSQNYNLIASLKDDELKNNLHTATTALPQTKDFAGILTAISNAAGLAGVTLNDYTFQIGDLSSKTALSPDQNSVKINLTINGTIDQTKKFLQALEKQLPISEVTDMTIPTKTSASINANFFYSPLPTINFVDTNPIAMLTAPEKKILQDLGSINALPNAPQASNSAVAPPRLSVPTPTQPVGSASAAQL